MFPRNTFARRRIGRMLRHRYTRVPVVDLVDTGQIQTSGFIANPGVEEDLNGFDALAATNQRTTTTVLSGGASLQTVLTDAISGPSYGSPSTWGAPYRLPVQVGRLYTASVSAMVSSVSPRTFSFGIEWYDSMLQRILPDASLTAMLDSSGWDELSVSGTAPQGAAFAMLRLYTAGAQGIFDLFTDDWQLDREPVDDELDGLDDYGDPMMIFGIPVANQPCLYEASTREASTRMVRTDHGTELFNRPTLFVSFDDPLVPGDEVHDVRDSDGYVYIRRAVAEEHTEVGPGGPRVYQAFALREVTTPTH